MEAIANVNPSVHINCTCGYNTSLATLKSKYLENISSDVITKENGGIELISILDALTTTYDFDYEDSIMLFVHRVCKELLITNIEYAYRFLKEYVKFMALLVLKIQNLIPVSVCQPDLKFIPSAKIFAMWRFHILYSSKYIVFCQKINKGERLHLNINKIFNLEIIETDENLASFKTNYEGFISIYRYYYGDIVHIPFWPDFHTNTIEYVFRFCLFPQSYKYMNSKLQLEEKNDLESLIVRAKTISLSEFRSEICSVLNRYREHTGMTFQKMKAYWETRLLAESKEDPQNLALRKMENFFNGNVSVISEIKSDPEIMKKFINCCTFSFPENFYSILTHEMFLDCESIGKLVTEYRRFLFLRCYKPKMVFTPSEEVDVVWHLHLNFTFLYLKTTRQLLGFEYLHNPTKGGKKELDKHTSLYDNTLGVYQKLFGNAGNLNWPGGKERFTTNPYWFIFTEKYLNGRLEKMSSKSVNYEKNPGFIKYLRDLDWKIKLALLVFLFICAAAGGFIGYTIENYQKERKGFAFRSLNNGGGD